MSKLSNPRKKTVELQPAARPSRIRRDPVRSPGADDAAKKAYWRSSEWEIRLAIVGIVLFALALTALWVGISEVTSH